MVVAVQVLKGGGQQPEITRADGQVDGRIDMSRGRDESRVSIIHNYQIVILARSENSLSLTIDSNVSPGVMMGVEITQDKYVFVY